MGIRMTTSDWCGRAAAYEEAADHLELSWTDSKIERKQGQVVQALLRKEAEKAHLRAKRQK